MKIESFYRRKLSMELVRKYPPEVDATTFGFLFPKTPVYFGCLFSFYDQRSAFVAELQVEHFQEFQ